MPLSLAFAQTTLLLRDLLLHGLRTDSGWTVTGGTPRVTMLPHGKPDKGNGDRLNIALISALPSQSRHDEGAAFDLRYLVTAHVFMTLHVELLLGMVLQTVTDNPVLGDSPLGHVESIEASLTAGSGRADVPSRLSLVDIVGLRLEPLRLPAIVIEVTPVVATAPVVQRLMADR